MPALCEEFILETAELKLVIRRRGAAEATDRRDRLAESGVSERHGEARASSTVDMGSAPPPPQAAAGTEIRSPMVGTFYRAPSPDAPAFVEIGTKVAAGDPLCMIEVMKLFTTIYAETDGIVVEICALDGEAVEYGRVLFVIEEAR